MTENTLHLTLMKRWFDLMREDRKPIEYREAKKYWITRFVRKNSHLNPEEWVFREFDAVKLVNGGHFGDIFPSIVRKFIKIHLYEYDPFDVGHPLYPKNGEPLKHGKYYFAIELGAITERWKC